LLRVSKNPERPGFFAQFMDFGKKHYTEARFGIPMRTAQAQMRDRLLKTLPPTGTGCLPCAKKESPLSRQREIIRDRRLSGRAGGFGNIHDERRAGRRGVGGRSRTGSGFHPSRKGIARDVGRQSKTRVRAMRHGGAVSRTGGRRNSYGIVGGCTG
jgi:hypothetical protein